MSQIPLVETKILQIMEMEVLEDQQVWEMKQVESLMDPLMKMECLALKVLVEHTPLLVLEILVDQALEV